MREKTPLKHYTKRKHGSQVPAHGQVLTVEPA
jgi:hypothetical protein